MTELEPLFDNVYIKMTQIEMEGILEIPENAQEKPFYGEVIAVGPDVKEVKVGHIVLFKKYMPTEIDENETCITKESDLLGTLI